MSEFEKMMKKQYGKEVYFGAPPIECWPTSIYDLDRKLGGGLPAGRASLFVGKSSVGKTTCAKKIAGVVNSTDWETGERCEPATGNTCKVLYVDAEGTLDKEYARCHNYYPEQGGNVVMSTETGNQTVDAINFAIQSGEFSLIILDSLEALVPYRDLEKSSEDAVMGTKAKMNNDAYRRWTVALISASRKTDKWWQKPTLLVINQLRDSIGSVPMPPTIPGGIGQTNGSSVIVQFNNPKYSDDGKLASLVNFKGVVKKNKVYTPRGGIDFFMAVKDLPEQGLKLGEVDNIASVVKDIRKYNIWEKSENGWKLFDYEVEKQAEFSQIMKNDPVIEADITKKTIEWLKNNV